MTRTGRRPGKRDTRAEIVAAARAVFAEVGYAGASIRQIAQRAGVDPALVHHYFDGKVALFTQVMGLPTELPGMAAELSTRERPDGGAIVRAFLTLWDGHPAGVAEPNPFLSLVQAICSSPRAAESLAEYAAERFWPRDGAAGGDREWQVRRALVGSQLIGLGFQRYVLRAELMAAADADQVAAWVGPVIDRYLHDSLPGLPAAASPRQPRSQDAGGGRPGR